MIEYTSKIRASARRVLEDGRVDAVIGFRRGTIPMISQPALVTAGQDIDNLHWDSFCGINLANYLPKRRERIAIVAKGCDSRNIVVHLLENQVKRDQLYIMGIPCSGMVDRRKVSAALNGRQIDEVIEDEDSIVARGEGIEESLKKAGLLQDNCRICIHRNPVVYDELIGRPVHEQQGIDRYAGVRKIEALEPGERWKYFQDLVAPCIRCYACRDVCPLCYCPTCFVDESRPQWLGKGPDPTDTLTFHLLRAFHCTGRCTDCGACEMVCPVAIRVRQFTLKLEKDVLELYGHEIGLTIEQRPPLDLYRPDDPGDFVV